MTLVSTTTFDEGVVDDVIPVGGEITGVFGSPKYSADFAHGSRGAKFEAVSPSPYLILTPAGSGNSFGISVYFRPDATTGGAGIPINLTNEAGARQATLRLHPAGLFDIGNSANLRQVASTNSWVLGDWYRADMYVAQTPGTANIDVNIFYPDDSEIVYAAMSAAVTIPGVIETIRVGAQLASWAITVDTIRRYDNTDPITAFDPLPVVPISGDVLHTWVGAVTHNTVQVKAKTLNAASLQLATSTNPSMAGQTLSTAETPDSAGYTRFERAGLSPGVQYYYQLVDDTGNIGEVGRARTLPTPGTPAAFTVVLAACTLRNQLDGRAHNSIRAWDPDFVVHTGDFYYTDSSSTLPAFYEDLYSNMVETYPGHAELVRDVPFWTSASDHEAGPDNGDSNNAWTVAHIAAFDQVVPHRIEDARVPTRARYQSWVAGRVRFIMTDVRTPDRTDGATADSSAKTMLGAVQKAWLKDQLLMPEPLKIIITDPAWMGPYALDNATDKWWAYAIERQEIIDFVAANSLQVEVWHGDSHSLGVKGKNNPYGGFPVLLAAPLAQAGGGRNLGEFDATYNSGAVSRQYMRVSFTDDGSVITRTAVGWDAVSDVERISSVETYSTTPGETAPGSVIVTGLKKSVAQMSVIVGGVKKTVASVSTIVGGVKRQ